nr:MAG TPA: hypothetical protein [Caudoviricetes sp.]
MPHWGISNQLKSRTTPKMALSHALRITKTTIFAISTDKEQR